MPHMAQPGAALQAIANLPDTVYGHDNRHDDREAEAPWIGGAQNNEGVSWSHFMGYLQPWRAANSWKNAYYCSNYVHLCTVDSKNVD